MMTPEGETAFGLRRTYVVKKFRNIVNAVVDHHPRLFRVRLFTDLGHRVFFHFFFAHRERILLSDDRTQDSRKQNDKKLIAIDPTICNDLATMAIGRYRVVTSK